MRPQDVEDMQPFVWYEDNTYYQIACVQCKHADKFTFYFSADIEKFLLKCVCGNIKEIKTSSLKKEPIFT